MQLNVLRPLSGSVGNLSEFAVICRGIDDISSTNERLTKRHEVRVVIVIDDIFDEFGFSICSRHHKVLLDITFCNCLYDRSKLSNLPSTGNEKDVKSGERNTKLNLLRAFTRYVLDVLYPYQNMAPKKKKRTSRHSRSNTNRRLHPEITCWICITPCVRISSEILSLTFVQQFGTAIFLDPTWDVANITKCSKSFRALFFKLRDSRPSTLSGLAEVNTNVLKVVIDVLSNSYLSDYLQMFLDHYSVSLAGRST